MKFTPAVTPASFTYDRSAVWLAGVRQEGGQGVETTVTALPVRVKDLLSISLTF